MILLNPRWKIAFGPLFGPLSVNLTHYLAEPAGSAAPEVVLAALSAREEVLAAGPWRDYRVFFNSAFLELCALAAEQAGDDELASFYAEKGLERYLCWAVSSASLLALLGRVMSRKNNRPNAEQHWRSAAKQVLEARDPMLVLRIADDWRRCYAHATADDNQAAAQDAAAAAEVPGADEGGEATAAEIADLVAQASSVMGRPLQELLQEFRAAQNGQEEEAFEGERGP